MTITDAIKDFEQLQDQFSVLKSIDMFSYDAKAEAIFIEARNLINTYNSLLGDFSERDIQRIYKIRGGIGYKIKHLEPFVNIVLRHLKRNEKSGTPVERAIEALGDKNRAQENIPNYSMAQQQFASLRDELQGLSNTTYDISTPLVEKYYKRTRLLIEKFYFDEQRSSFLSDLSEDYQHNLANHSLNRIRSLKNVVHQLVHDSDLKTKISSQTLLLNNNTLKDQKLWFHKLKGSPITKHARDAAITILVSLLVAFLVYWFGWN